MKNQTKRILRILFIMASVGSLWFVPWIVVKAWIMPLPDTVQEQVNAAIDYGFDGTIVYVDEAGKPPAFYAAGLKIGRKRYQQTQIHYSKSPVLVSYMSQLPLQS